MHLFQKEAEFQACLPYCSVKKFLVGRDGLMQDKAQHQAWDTKGPGPWDIGSCFPMYELEG